MKTTKHLTAFDFLKISREERIHFLINIIIGIFIAGVLYGVEATDWGEKIINNLFDPVITKEATGAARLAEQVSAEISPHISNRIVFIDIDHETYKRWGRPLLTPRKEIARIIEDAYRKGAGIIVLDILLEKPDCCNPDGDIRLRSVLQEMADKKSPTKVLFASRIGNDRNFKKNLFDDLIDKTPNFFRASVNVSASPTDRMVRYWVPFEEINSTTGSSALWNISFLAAVLSEDKLAELSKLSGLIESGQFQKSFHLRLGNNKEIELTPDKEDLYRYRIRYFLIPKNTMSNHEGGNLFNSAFTIDEADNIFFKDKIVIIGNSSPDAYDMHPTPIGNMAGMYIIGNALNTILLGNQPSEAHLIVRILMEIAVIILAAYLFLKFTSFAAAVIGSSMLFLLSITISYYYFIHFGVFLNFSFALAAMGFHKIVMNIEQIINEKSLWRKKGTA
jgi:CHASE2 domain-containing sensor protein